MSALAVAADDAATAELPEVIAFATDAASRDVLAGVAGLVETGDATSVRDTLAHIPTPPVLVIDLTDLGDPIGALGELADVCDPGTTVVAIGTANDIGLFRQLTNFGVADYLLKPLDALSLRTSIARAVAQNRPAPAAELDAEPQSRMRTIVVTGSRGGVGASTVALGLAWQAAYRHGKRTMLIDLDLQFGTTALALDLEPGRGLREALENPGRIDGMFLASAAVKLDDNFSVLCAEEPLDGLPNPSIEALDQVLDELRPEIDCVVIDLPRALAGVSHAMLARAQSLVLVSDLTLAGMRDSLRLRKLARMAAPKAKVITVANRADGKRPGELRPADFERGYDAKIDFLLPDNPKASSAASAAGKPITEASGAAKIKKLIVQLADTAIDAAPDNGHRPWWSLKRS